MNTAKLWILWLALYFGPMFAGTWWDDNFHFMQAVCSLTLLLAALHWADDGWMPVFSTLVTLQILVNVTDYLMNLPIQHYNDITGTLNFLEFAVLFGVGGITQLVRLKYGSNSISSDLDPSNFHAFGNPQNAKERRGA